jgi:predicted dehydrogenase
VIIGTPSGTHHDLAVAAMQAGKHVLVEKPLEISLSRIDHMLEIAEQTGMRLGSIFQSRMREGAQAAKQAVEAGRLGDLILANAFVPWSRDSAYYRNNWRGTWAWDGGGALMNQSIHTIDLLQWLAGDVTSLMAYTATRRHAIETEDTGTAVLQFDNGAQGVIQGTTALSRGHDSRVELQGKNGSILLLDGRIEQWQIDDMDDEEEQEMRDLDTLGGGGASDPMAIGSILHQKQIEQFLTAIRERTDSYLSGREARYPVEIVLAIYQAAQTGKEVYLHN